ncbi:MAG: cytochrome P450 [Alphaproteobacteria bacterium]
MTVDVAGFDLRHLTPEFLDDPFPTYKALRERSPVHRCPDGSYFLTRYADVSAVYRDRRMSSDKKVEFAPKYGDSPLYKHHTTSLVFNDPPLHTRVRRLLAAAFTPRALAALQPRVERVVAELLDAAAPNGTMDLIGAFAFALPVEVIGDMLGVPKADRPPLRGYSLAILGALEPAPTQEQLDRGNAAVSEFSAYLDDLIAERTARPSDDDADILSRLIEGEVDGERLTHDELVQNCIFLLNAGHETTTNLIGNGIAALLRFPDEMARLRADPSLMRPAVEEFLRYESSNQIGNRRVAEDAEVGGVKMPAGTLITMCIGAANRDPAEFAEPDRLDIGREPNRHLAFAGGPHICLGNSLARMEASVAIRRLLERFPRLEATGDHERGGRARFRGYKSFGIAW